MRIRKSANLSKKNYLKEDGSGFYRTEQTHLFIKEEDLYQVQYFLHSILPTKVAKSPLQIALSFPELFVSK